MDNRLTNGVLSRGNAVCFPLLCRASRSLIVGHLLPALLLCGAVSLVGACSPQVQFTRYSYFNPKQARENVDHLYDMRTPKVEPGAIDFFLRASTIVIAIDSESPNDDLNEKHKESKKQRESLVEAVLGGRQEITGLEELQKARAAAVPLELSDLLYRAVPNESFLYSPNISFTYVAHSLLLASLGSDSVDHGAQLLQVAGALAVATAALAGSDQQLPPEKLRLPVLIDVRELAFGASKAILGCGEQVDSHNQCTTWRYRLDPAGPILPAEDVDKFFQRQKAWSREFPYAVCQDVWVTISNMNLTDQPFARFKVRIADPTRVRSYLIPKKGAIKFDGICGADLSREGIASSAILDDLEALADAVKQVKDARSAAAIGSTE